MYSIADLEFFTGLNSQQIRHLLRSLGLNQRKFSEQEFKKVLMTNYLLSVGYEVEQLKEMSLFDLQMQVQAKMLMPDSHSLFAEQMLVAISDFNYAHLNNLVNELWDQYGVQYAFERIIFPFLQKLKLLWVTEAVTQLQMEFAYNHLTRFLFSKLYVPNQVHAYEYVFFTSSLCLGEPLLIYGFYLFSARSIYATYLGQLSDLQMVCQGGKFHDKIFVLSSMWPCLNMIHALQECSKEVIFLNFELKQVSGLRILNDFDQIREFVRLIEKF